MKTIIVMLMFALSGTPAFGGVVKSIDLQASGQLKAEDLERGWTLVKEDLDIFVDPTSGQIRLEGTLIARLTNEESSPGPMLAMNSRDKLMQFDEVSAAGAKVQLNVIHPEREASVLAPLAFASPKKRGDEVEIHFVCHSEGEGRQLVVSESVALASWVEAWYPILLPAEGVSLSGAAKVPGTVQFHLPKGWHAVTNGGLISSDETEDGTIEVWKTDRALARSFAAGPYEVIREKVGDLDVSIYLLSDDLPNPRDNVSSLAVAMKAMEKHLGDYPYPSYAIAEIPSNKGSFGASSEQGFIMVKPEFLQVPGGNLPLFAHESAHGWWGNTVGTDGEGALICSETLAQYGAVMAAESVWGREGATEFLRFSRPGYVPNQCARGYFEILRRGKDKALNTLESGGEVDHTLADSKGHWVIHMLRRRVGDEVFFATMRGLIAEFTDSKMSLASLQDRFKKAAPDADLEQFFTQWFERTGAPVLTHEWQKSPKGLSLTIHQNQKGDPFHLWLDVRMIDKDGLIHDERVKLNKRKQTFQLSGVNKIAEVILDPDHELLKWEPEYGAAPIAGLEDLEPRQLDPKLLATCSGEFVLPEAGIEISVSTEGGHLLLELKGETQRLVHAGETRFRSKRGFVIFKVTNDRAGVLVFLPDGGRPRVAMRKG